VKHSNIFNMSEAVETQKPTEDAVSAVSAVKGMKKNGTPAFIGPTRGLTG
jgi:hypothetical protein